MDISSTGLASGGLGLDVGARAIHTGMVESPPRMGGIRLPDGRRTLGDIIGTSGSRRCCVRVLKGDLDDSGV